ncbi:PH and SEC7 domain-containing protein 4 [Chanos chanos]|uniref:PH and SEC7 domain-containing protein 4 n=1 Tax=Chanos chanos TaxID=29144 RepID=A0A6J2UVH5_CHACN|nr:PH and SEC7 domain-containing protein 4-like [Chanos chanos]
MEKNLVIPTHLDPQETSVCQGEELEPYIEAQLYIRRMEQEEETGPEEKTDESLLNDDEPSDQSAPLTTYPLTLPVVPFSCATVQWDIQATPTELPSPEQDTYSTDELNSSGGASLDWTDNPLSTDMPPSLSVLEDGPIDTHAEEDCIQRDNTLELQEAVALDKSDSSYQDSATQDSDIKTCVTPPQEEDHTPFKDNGDTTQVEETGPSESLQPHETNDNSPSPLNKEEISADQKSPECVLKDTEDPVEHTEADSRQEDEEEDKSSDSDREQRTEQSNPNYNGEYPEADVISQDTSERKHSGDVMESNTSDIINQQVQITCADQLTESVEKEELDPEEESKPVEETEPVGQLEVQEESDHTEKSERVSHEAPQSNITEPTEVSEQPQAHTEKSVENGQSEDSEQLELTAKPDIPQQELIEHAETSELRSTDEVNKSDQLLTQDLLGHIGNTEQMEHSEQSNAQEQPICSVGLECLNETEPSQQSKQSECLEQSELSEQLERPEHSEFTEKLKQSESSEMTECSEVTGQSQLVEETEPPDSTEKSEPLPQMEKEQPEQVAQTSLSQSLTPNTDEKGEQLEEPVLTPESKDKAVPYVNGRAESVDREEARRLAERLYRLEGFQRRDVVRHLDKDNDFSRAVGEEYLKYFDFTDQSLDQALRSFLKVVVLIGETQERERVLQLFSNRYQQCNPKVFSSEVAVLTLTCAVMLLNTDLHGQNVGKAMSLSDFTANLDGMNEGKNFHKDLLKNLYTSIKNEPLEWAVDEKELLSSMMLEGDADAEAAPRSKSNPFQDLPHDKKATVFHKGFLKRKAHADIDGKRTPWGKRSWKTFYAVLKGMVLYLQKDEYRMDWQSSEEVVSVHHALAERALDYTKRPHVFRLQTADWRVFLFEAASTEQMNLWIGRINLVSALYSSPPFPAAVGSQRKFCRPILPATQTTLALDKQMQSHAAMLQSFQEDLASLQQGLPEGRRAKARELEEHRLREEYLQHEKCRYEMYIVMLEAWQHVDKSLECTFTAENLSLFDQEVWKGMEEEEEDESEGALKRSHSSPSLELELAPPPVVKVRRNISERRTYRKIVVPRRNREL